MGQTTMAANKSKKSEFENFKFADVKKAYLKFPEVREYSTSLFGSDRVIVSVLKITPKRGEVSFTFVGDFIGSALVFRFEVCVQDPRRFYGFTCESITNIRRNFMYGGKIKTLDKFVNYLNEQRKQHENLDTDLSCKRRHPLRNEAPLCPPGRLHAPLLVGKTSGAR